MKQCGSSGIFLVCGSFVVWFILMDVQAHVTPRTFGPLERDKDILKSTNGSATPGDENERSFSTGIDGWESSRMKKKRSIIKPDVSASLGLVKPQCDRETKRGMQQKLGIDARTKHNYSHNFRYNILFFFSYACPFHLYHLIDYLSSSTFLFICSVWLRRIVY